MTEEAMAQPLRSEKKGYADGNTGWIKAFPQSGAGKP
jgi:hypothetical protein